MSLIQTYLTRCKRCVHLARHRYSSSSSIAKKPAKQEECGPTEGDADAGGWAPHVVSGLQPTGALHVGNYFGALRRCVRAQQEGLPLTLFVADLHALTTHAEASALQENSLRLTALALAAGVDPAPGHSALFVQSAVPRHAELCWLLACLCSQARLHHLPQYRERASRSRDADVPLGLLLYPVLQAADVLLHRATLVPVGADQLQHLQLAAQLARTFHHRYGNAFPVPRPLLPDDGSDRIRSLRDPLKKMSKSDPNGKATILLTDSDDDIRRKVRKAVTDFTPQVTFDPESRPGVANLIRLHCLAADKLPEEVVEESDGLTTAQYKAVVAEALCSALRPLRTRAAELLRRPKLLRHVLRDGAARARRRADETYDHVARLVGLTPARASHDPPLHVVRLPDSGDCGDSGAANTTTDSAEDLARAVERRRAR